MDGGNRDVDSAGRVVVGTTSRACNREVIFIFTEDVGAEDGQIDVVHGDLTHLWQVDGHLSRLQMEEACLIDDYGEKDRVRERKKKIKAIEKWD